MDGKRSEARRGAAAMLACGVLFAILTGCSTTDVVDPGKALIAEYPELDAKVLSERIRQIDENFKEPRTPAKVAFSLETARNSISPVDKYEALWRAVRACAWLAHNHPDREVRYQHALEGERLGREAKLRLSSRVETYYYLALCLGAKAEEQPIPGTDLIKSIEYNIKVAYSMPQGKGFDRCGPARFLGTLMVETQDAGFGYTVGTLDQGLALLREACNTCPDFGENYLMLAKALAKVEEYSEARIALGQVIQSPVPADHSVEHAAWLREAQDLLRDVAGRDDDSVEATTYRVDEEPEDDSVPATVVSPIDED